MIAEMTKNTKRPTLIVIPNYIAQGKQEQNRWLLETLIKSFVEHERDVDLLVIDDGSRGLQSKSYYYSFAFLCKNSTIRFGFETMDRNMGFAATVNHGLERARVGAYKYVVLLNNDVELLGPFVDRMDKVFSSIPKLSVWGPRLLYPDGRIQSAGFEFNSEGVCTHFDRDKFAAANPGDSLRSKAVQGVTGAFMGLRADSPARFNEDYFMAYEDVDFCLETWKRGNFVFYDGTVDAIHHEGATRGVGMSATELQSLNLFKSRLQSFVIPRTKMLIRAVNCQLEAVDLNHEQLQNESNPS
jgi:GT2 family glycosyltransferase